LKTHVVKYEDAVEVLQEIMDAKTEYEQIVKKDIEDDLDTNYKRKLLKMIDADDFYDEIPNTAILMDDAMNLLNGNKYIIFRFPVIKKSCCNYYVMIQ
jgi:hypothetical protein